MRSRRLSVIAALLTAATSLVALGPAHGAAGTYYVSPNGDDNNSGLSPSEAWRTIGKVNAFTFPQGSLVYFEGGQTFTGCLVFDSGNVPNSSATTPFRVYSYGSGQATIRSNCTGDYSAAVTVDNVSGFRLNNVKLVNGGTTAAGVLLQNQESSEPTQSIVISNSRITGFTTPAGSSSSFGGAIQIIGYAVNGNNGPMNDIQILDNHLYGASKTSADGPAIGGWGYGQNITDVMVDGNNVYNLGMLPKTVGGAITANGWNGAVIQHNKVHDIGANVTSCGGTAGILAYTSSHITIRYNEVYNVEPYPSYVSGCDWDGIDLDGGVDNSVVEYNYTHDNAGNGLLAYVDSPGGKPWGPNTFRYNISENDDTIKAQGGLMGVVPRAPTGALSIYGNTFFSNVNQSSKSTASACFFFGYAGGTWASGSQIKNNICHLANRDQYGRPGHFYYNPNGQTGMPISNNLYYTTGTPWWRWGGTTHSSFAAWQAAGLETGPVWGNPLFASAGNGGTCSWTPASGTGPQPCPSAYRLQSGSPALRAGVNIVGNGGLDYFQDPIPNPPNIGADAG
ncbi:right-handed parallel beta-helix repeat-containing protein [Jiangella aurantiaca]|uniref:Right-handed parallel beta-helix repeat-containing protein n=1 Tax=Jiangella aurantiaca TaxID=2530373 RepID=A0A4R5AJ99_9ACTN|nr:right-handed parallel beta-helix repeat-containing protein [Jiangella aurantiaca]TDD72641.1 right-handed parallel beta-helix repeat-containing protein [Jiangella aurantiaca]